MTKDGPVLVTGASGFLGAWLMARLARSRRAVVGCDLKPDVRLLEMVDCAAAPAVAWHACDVTDAEGLAALIASTRPAALVHLAGMLIPGCRAHPAAGVRVNVIGQINVLATAHAAGIERVLYTSSMAAKPRGPAEAPANLYGVLKRTGEEVSRVFHDERGISSFGLRPHVVYGAGREVGETAAVTLAMRAAARGRAYEIPWRTATCFQLADDVAALFERLLDAPWTGALISDVSDVVETSDDVVSAILDAVPGARISVGAEERLAPTSGFDTAALERTIGPLARTGLREGARRTVEHYRRLAAAGA